MTVVEELKQELASMSKKQREEILQEFLKITRKKKTEQFVKVVQKVINIPYDQKLQKSLQSFGLCALHVMWEYTARTPGSCWGDNISDMTLQLRYPQDVRPRQLLPVIRYPNFTDKTADIPFDLVKMKVGNEKDKDLQVITLREYLINLDQYVSYPDRLHRENKPLVTDKDTHILVSAQACFLPIPAQDKCSFNPVLFNYQSRKDNPAVLVILITTEGSSATVIDNAHDVAQWGQNIYFNHNGQKTCLTGERLTDFKESQAQEIAKQEGISIEAARSKVKVDQDVNMVMLVQVPLKRMKDTNYKNFYNNTSIPEEDLWDYVGCLMSSVETNYCYTSLSDSMPEDDDWADISNFHPIDESKNLGLHIKTTSQPTSIGYLCSGTSRSDMEDAVISYGEDEGEHLESSGYKLDRDDRYPIRLTVQFYKATSNGVIDQKDLQNILSCIKNAYNSADYIGSLVTGSLEKGDLGMGSARPTQPAPLPQSLDYLEVINPFPITPKG